MINRLLSSIAAFLMIAGLAWSVAAQSPDAAKNYASKIGDRVLSVMNNKSLSDSKKLDDLEALFVNVVDVDWVGRFVLGKYWRSATEEQKKAYLDAYRVFLIKHYTSRFADYSGETFELPVAREDRENEYFVRMEIARPAGQAPVVVDYRLRYDQAKKDFKVFDIIVEGVSLISTQRSEFGSVVGRKGLDTLIEKLKAKTDKLNEEMHQQLAEKK
ncbi:MAG: MlaC/ttg2D family ABC transporter substrate-binding protein [Rickettsiales bacterium]